MTNYWISWFHNPEESFTLANPWWVTGERISDGFVTICGAFRGESLDEIKEEIYKSYDIRPNGLEWRFANKRPDKWSPFSDRFQSDKWMDW